MASSQEENKEPDLGQIEENSNQENDSPSADHIPSGDPEGCDPEKQSENRERKCTAKGQAYFSEIRGKARKTAYSALSKQIAKVRQLLDDNANERTLEAERDCLDKLKEELNEAQRSFDELIDNEKEREKSYQWFDIRDRECFEIRAKLVERLRAFEIKSRSNSRRGSMKSGYSFRSKSSLVSGKSSSRSIRLEAAARTARLKAEMTFLERDNEIRRIQMMKDIAIAEAEEKAIKETIEQEKLAEMKQNPPIKLDPTVSPFIPKLPQDSPQESRGDENPAIKKESDQIDTRPRNQTPITQEQNTNDSCHGSPLNELISLQAKQTELSSLLINQQKRINLPTKEPPVFSGNAFDYPAFITAFDSIISENVPSNKDRLFFLNKYTDGKANEVVKGFLAVNSEHAYTEARKLLDQRFGNPIHVAEAYKSRLRNWPQIRDGDSAGLQAFSDFLLRCQEAVKIVGSISELDSNQNLIQVSTKLPSYSGVKWCRHAYETRTKSASNTVTFSDFVRFVKGESELANDPVFSPDALKRERKGHPDYNTRDNRSRWRNKESRIDSFAIGIFQEEPSSQLCPQRTVTKCPFCEKNHALGSCQEFKKKKVEDRVEFIKIKGLCFGCLKPGHLSISCQSRLTCEECGKLHPTLLHVSKPAKLPAKRNQTGNKQPKEPNNDESINASTSVSNYVSDHCVEATTCMVVPVILTHKENTSVKIFTYALLDNGSDSTFINSSILTKLQVNGPEITLKLNTMYGQTEIEAKKIEGLVVQHINQAEVSIALPRAYSRDIIPSKKGQIPTPEKAKKWPHLDRIKDKLLPLQEDMEIGILIGCNCPKALKPREVILGRDEDPYAVRTLLGWGIIGPIVPTNSASGGEEGYLTCHRIATREIGSSKLGNRFTIEAQTKEVVNPFEVRRMFELDFSERCNGQPEFSQEDCKFLNIARKGIRLREDSHYEMPLPMKEGTPSLPHNRIMARNRLRPLKKRLESNSTYRSHYVEFMNKLIENGYAERVSQGTQPDGDSKSAWYIPHHGVYHPKKPNKIRVVFDCSAQYEGESLNKHLLQGPDLTNNLTGVLCRFRREPVALMCDIEAMFHQVKVTEEYRDFLRFLWWEDGDTSREPQDYRMTVHLFGATSSPGCCNFALKTTADDNEETFGPEPAEFLRRDFYVDDGLKSVPSIEEAVALIKSTKKMCLRGGFNLHKFTSNKKDVIQEIPVLDRAEDVKNLDFDREPLPIERALGVQWCIESDTFKFVVSLKDRPCTRRGILSTVSSIFDPLGFVAPVLLEGKAILQELCRQNLDWDDPVPEEIQKRWLKWKSEIKELKNVEISRCYKPNDFGHVVKAELHHFSDASFKGYGQCSYLRMVNQENQIHCSFVIGKARVTPLKSVTVPRLELNAAVVSVRVSEQLRRELDIDITDEIFWTDSRVVLGYIANDVKRFHVFVANRVQEIQEKSSVKQWKYVDTKSNPADEASRGVRPRDLSKSKWITGPDFLWKDKAEWEIPQTEAFGPPLEDDPEVKKVVLATEVLPSWPTVEERMEYFPDWYRARKAVALCLRYLQKLKSMVETRRITPTAKLEDHVKQIKPVTVQELSEAETVILKSVQQVKLPDLSPSSSLSKLDAFVDSDGIARVGGRLKLSSLPYSSKHPALLPKASHVTDLIIRHCHQRTQHQGRGITANEIRASGYWIIGASGAIASAISKCVKCRKLRGAVQEQRMAELPDDRVEPAPPFTNSAVDCFGPFIIKEGRKELKRYGVLFTCMASRAIHIEVAATLETDSFINALRRFLCRRGPIRQLRSDQGTNFVGARRELKEGLDRLDHTRIRNELQHHNCDWFVFNMNFPSASHMGGVWERQIRSVRNVLASLLQSNSTQLNEESLSTLLCEAEAIVNSRPLTVDSLNDPLSPYPLTPNHLLTMKTKVVLPPPGVFQSADMYCRKRWRRVQHLANEFWVRWKKEYLQSLQQRQRWTKPRRETRVGDVVIVKDDDQPRNKWQLARVVETFPSADGHVRKVKIAVADRALDRSGKQVRPTKFLERPVQKLVLLQEAET